MITIKELHNQCIIWNKNINVYNKPKTKGMTESAYKGFIIGFSKNV